MESLRNALQHPWVFHSGYNIVNAAERRKSNTECGDCLLKYMHKYTTNLSTPISPSPCVPSALCQIFRLPAVSPLPDKPWNGPKREEKERRKRPERDQKERKGWDRAKIQPFSWIFGGWVGRFVVFSAFGRLWARERVEGRLFRLGWFLLPVNGCDVK